MHRIVVPLLLVLLGTSAHAGTIRLNQSARDGLHTAFATIEIDSISHHVISVTGTDFGDSEYTYAMTPSPLADGATYRGGGPWVHFFVLYERWYSVWIGEDGRVSGVLRKGGPGYVADLHGYRPALAPAEGVSPE